MAEGAPLLREYGLKAHRGFESLSLRQIQKSPHRAGFFVFDEEVGLRALSNRRLRVRQICQEQIWSHAAQRNAPEGQKPGWFLTIPLPRSGNTPIRRIPERKLPRVRLFLWLDDKGCFVRKSLSCDNQNPNEEF